MDSTYIGETSRGGPKKEYNHDGYTLDFLRKKCLPGAVGSLGNGCLLH